MSVKDIRPNFAALQYTEAELDYVYNHLAAATRQQVDLAVQIALGGQGWQNVRPGSDRWLDQRREIMTRMLCEAEETVLDAGLDSPALDSWCDTYLETNWKRLEGWE